jgi:amidase
MDDLIYASATALARAIRAKEVSAVEVIEAHLQRIEVVNAQLNAVVTLTADMARQQAQAADTALARGDKLGALHGVPITIKDSLDTAGIITTAGTQGRATFRPGHDATVVARLRAAGAILLGKTNTPELTLAGLTDNSVFGRTNNPYDLNRTPAGSSGGAAAIIAAGGSPLDLGSDTGGSIRVPCHFCGIAGLKPTSGRVPRTGHIISFDIGAMDALTQIGPMARYVEDLILTLPIIAGVDWRDPTIMPVPLGDPRQVDLSHLRVSCYIDNGIVSPTLETVEVVRAAANALADTGAAIIEERPPEVERGEALWDELFQGDGGAMVQKLLQAAGTMEVHALTQWVLQKPAVPTADFGGLFATWNIYRSRMLAYMENYDLILCPVSAGPATLHQAEEHPDFSYVTPYNLTGWPGAVVRAGTSPEGLPIGVQIIAQPWREDVALAAARHLERVLGGWQRPSL